MIQIYTHVSISCQASLCQTEPQALHNYPIILDLDRILSNFGISATWVFYVCNVHSVRICVYQNYESYISLATEKWLTVYHNKGQCIDKLLSTAFLFWKQVIDMPCLAAAAAAAAPRSSVKMQVLRCYH